MVTSVDLDKSDSESNDESIINTTEIINEEKKKKTIYTRAFNQRLNESDLFQIFNKFGMIAKIELKTQYSALVEFCDKSSVDKIMSKKKKIFFKGKNLVIQNARKIIPEKRNVINVERLKEEKMEKNSKTLELKNISAKNEKFIAMEINQKKLDYNDEQASLKEKVERIAKNMEEYEKELNKQGKELKDCKEVIAKQGKIISKNENEISNLKISLNIMAEIIEQKDIYYKSNFEYLNKNIRLLLNLYKILYIRKFANLLLEQIYIKYSNDLGKWKIETRKKKYNIIALLPTKKNELKEAYYQINLLIDFLRFIWDESSKAIHINDENFPLQKEVFYEYLKPLKNTYSEGIETEEGININILIRLIFDNKEKVKSKENNFQLSNNNLVNAIQKMLQKLENTDANPKDINNDKGSIIIQLSDSDSEKSDDLDYKLNEKEIKNIIKNNLKEYDMNKELKKLVQLIEKNKKGRKLFGSDNDVINGEFFYNSWLQTFENEIYKSKDVYKKYFKKEKIFSLKEMGLFLCALFEGKAFNIFENDPKDANKMVKKKLPK